MVENRNANIVGDCWLGLPGHYPYVSLDAFVVMPDHVHGIIVLVDAGGAGGVQTDAARAGNGVRVGGFGVLGGFQTRPLHPKSS
jgi:hypothetical protein